MGTNNDTTTVTEFILTGFPGLKPQYYGLVGVFFLLVYVLLLTGNLFTIIFITSERGLHKPTYIIFCNLAICDLSFGSVTLPKAIAVFWTGDRRTSFNACFTQMFFVHFLGANSSFLLALMALDRFVAIQKPLRYPELIKNSTISILCASSWLFNVCQMLAVVAQALSVPYCGPNIIFRCYCDHNSLVRLACTTDTDIYVIAFGKAMFVLLGPLTFIVFSYISIIVSVMKITNSDGRYKTFSTCTPQLFIICIYFIPRCFMYIAYIIGVVIPIDLRIALIMGYSLFPALINPAIYCFRTKEIKDALIKRLKNRQVCVEMKLLF